jgi:hypothetical protein
MYKNLHKNLIPWRDSNPRSSVLEADAMATMPRRQGNQFNILIMTLELKLELQEERKLFSSRIVVH